MANFEQFDIGGSDFERSAIDRLFGLNAAPIETDRKTPSGKVFDELSMRQSPFSKLFGVKQKESPLNSLYVDGIAQEEKPSGKVFDESTMRESPLAEMFGIKPFQDGQNLNSQEIERALIEDKQRKNPPTVLNSFEIERILDREKKPTGKVFDSETFNNSPLGKQLSLDKIDVAGGTKTLVDGVKTLGAGLFKGLETAGPDVLSQVASMLQDGRKRGALGRLSEVEAATAPFSTGSLTKAFELAQGGSDVTGDLNEALLLKQNRKRRDDQEEFRNSIFNLKQSDALEKLKERLLGKKSVADTRKRLPLNENKLDADAIPPRAGSNLIGNGLTADF